MTWLIILFAVEAGWLSGNETMRYDRFDYPAGSGYLVLEADAQAGPVFIAGSVETQAQFSEDNGLLPGFNPYHAVYTVAVGVRHGVFEVGWRHDCRHDIESPAQQRWRSGGTDRLYVRAVFGEGQQKEVRH